MALRTVRLLSAIILLALLALTAFPAWTARGLRASAAPSVRVHAALPPRARLTGYPSLHQQYALSCEAAVASMATGGRLSEQHILDQMPRNPDPWLGFRGKVDGSQLLVDGLADYGIYAPPLAHELRGFGYQTVVISGTMAQALLRYSIGVLRRPVEVWVTHYLGDWPAITGHAAGHSFTLIDGEHARLAIGYDAHGVYTLDPLEGPQYDSWTTFLASWGRFAYMGIVIGASLPHPRAPTIHLQPRRGSALWWWSTMSGPLASRVTLFRAGRPLQQWLLAPQALPAPVRVLSATTVLTATVLATLSVSPTALHAGVVSPATAARSASLLSSPTWYSGPCALQVQVARSIPYTITVQSIDPLGLASPLAVSARALGSAPPSPPPPILPPAPVRASIIGPGLVRWAWSVGAGLTYRVISYRYLGAQPADYVDQTLGHVGTYVRAVMPNLTYYAQVVAIDGAGRSSPATPPLPAPLIVAAHLLGPVAGSLQPGGYGVWHWTARGATRFVVQSFAYAGSRVVAAQQLNTAVTTYGRRLIPGLTYYVLVRAVADDGVQTAPLMARVGLLYYPAQPVQQLRVQRLPGGRQRWMWAAQRDMRYQLTVIRYAGRHGWVVSRMQTVLAQWISAPTPPHMTDYLRVRAIDACGDRSAPVQHRGISGSGT